MLGRVQQSTGICTVFAMHCCQVLSFREALRHWLRGWETKVGDPKLLGIQLLLGNCTKESGAKLDGEGGGCSWPKTRLRPETPKLPDIQALLGHMDLGMSWEPADEDNDKLGLGKWERWLSSLGKVFSLVEVVWKQREVFYRRLRLQHYRQKTFSMLPTAVLMEERVHVYPYCFLTVCHGKRMQTNSFLRVNQR